MQPKLACLTCSSDELRVMVRAPCKCLDGRLVDRQLSERLTVTGLEDEHPVVIASAGKLWIDFMRPLQTNGTVSMISLEQQNLI